jgi:RHS repeat-associated protein
MVAVNYLWNPINDNIVREFDDGGATVAEYTTEPDLYGNVVSQYRGGQTSYLVSDGQGNATELTNDAGNVTDTIRYSAFGEVTERTGSTEMPFEYIGQKGYYRDADTCSISVRHRPLFPRQGRWSCADPLGYGDSTNLYQYVNGNPLSHLDPSGLAKIWCRCSCLAARRRAKVKTLIEIECGGLARKCCESACRKVRDPPKTTYPWLDECSFEDRLDNYGVVGAIPDSGQDADTCPDDWRDSPTYWNCVGCCIDQKEPGTIITAIVLSSAARWPKTYPRPGKPWTKSIWSMKATRDCTGLTIKGGIWVGRIGTGLFIVEGMYDLGLAEWCMNTGCLSKRPW